MRWFLLFMAIVAEVIATSLLKSTEGFTRLWPSVTVAVCYETAFILLALSMKKIPIGIVYAVWSGVGIMLITLAAWFFLGQTLDLAGFAGVALIISGVVAVTACADEGPGWPGSSEQIVGSDVTVVCWRWLPLMCACTHWNAWALRRCQVWGRFWARLWPTSATATLTGHSRSSRLRYLNSRKDSTASKRSSLQPWIANTATSRLPTWLVQPSFW